VNINRLTAAAVLLGGLWAVGVCGADQLCDSKSDGCSWDWGFRSDLVYGTDAQKTQAFGQLNG